ncbi:MAG: SUMF1/EgtB/PvdO family nonheme iron enzyme, partial [Acidobacteriota bacterium]
ILKLALKAAEKLPPPLRFVIVFLVLIVVIILSGRVVQTELIPLIYLLVMLGAGLYVWMEIRLRTRQPEQTTKQPPSQSPAVSSNGQPNSEELRNRYCGRLVSECNRLRLTTIDVKAATRPEAAELELSEVFTSLDVIESQRLEDLQEEGRASLTGLESQRLGRMPATAAVSRWKRLVLLGDPGSGKSTFVNYLSLCLAGDWLGEKVNASSLGEAWKAPRLLPVLVVLREYVAEGMLSGMSLWDFVQHRLSSEQKEADLSPFADSLSRHLQQTGGILILDGLDEVPEAGRARERLKEAVMAFRERFRACRILVTARPYAYQNEKWRLPGFEVRRLADFSPEQVESFIERWYRHVATKDPALSQADAERYAGQLKAQAKQNPRLKELAPRPLLLTLMASLHRWRGGGALPEKRQELYEAAVQLLLDLWQRPKAAFDGQGKPVTEFDVFKELGISQESLRSALEQVAYDVHRDQPVMTGAANIRAGKLAEAFFEASERKDDISIARVTRYLTQRAGLLIERVPEQEYAFPHRTFQEYLAACHLAHHDYPDLLAERLAEDDERWREVALLAASKAYSGSHSSIWYLLGRFCAPPGGEPVEAGFYAALLAAQAVIENGQQRRVPAHKRELMDRLRGRLEELCSSGALPPPDRAEAGRALSVLGDRRPGIGLRPDGAGLPDILWCSIAGGQLAMGSAEGEEGAQEDEIGPGGQPLPVQVAPFRLSAFPVTNAQFRPFVEGDGYTNADYWTKAGWAWKESSTQSQPVLWRHPDWNLDNHPVAGLAWYEAVAWCSWLTLRLRGSGELEAGQRVRLPSEAEWEWAARGPQGLKYPWGDEWRQDACNSQEAGVGRNCAVGIFPAGARRWAGPEADAHLHDLSGNVLEWCSTKRRKSYASQADESLQGEDWRILRGGGFWNDKSGVRCARRIRYNPRHGYWYIGFRCAQ